MTINNIERYKEQMEIIGYTTARICGCLMQWYNSDSATYFSDHNLVTDFKRFNTF